MADLKLALEAMQDCVTDLYLSSNSLNELGGKGLAEVLKAMPEQIAVLDLSRNNLNELGSRGRPFGHNCLASGWLGIMYKGCDGTWAWL